jgi:hypothetical protein
MRRNRRIGDGTVAEVDPTGGPNFADRIVRNLALAIEKQARDAISIDAARIATDLPLPAGEAPGWISSTPRNSAERSWRESAWGDVKRFA